MTYFVFILKHLQHLESEIVQLKDIRDNLQQQIGQEKLKYDSLEKAFTMSIQRMMLDD